jgi:hypothetical protein
MALTFGSKLVRDQRLSLRIAGSRTHRHQAYNSGNLKVIQINFAHPLTEIVNSELLLETPLIVSWLPHL